MFPPHMCKHTVKGENFFFLQYQTNNTNQTVQHSKSFENNLQLYWGFLEDVSGNPIHSLPSNLQYSSLLPILLSLPYTLATTKITPLLFSPDSLKVFSLSIPVMDSAHFPTPRFSRYISRSLPHPTCVLFLFFQNTTCWSVSQCFLFISDVYLLC